MKNFSRGASLAIVLSQFFIQSVTGTPKLDVVSNATAIKESVKYHEVMVRGVSNLMPIYKKKKRLGNVSQSRRASKRKMESKQSLN
jgi:hypothetical protein